VAPDIRNGRVLRKSVSNAFRSRFEERVLLSFRIPDSVMPVTSEVRVPSVLLEHKG
jgi:hypothetical protein